MSLRGYLLPADDRDVRSAYSAATSLAGSHRIVYAESLDEVDHTDDVRRLAEAAAAGDQRPLLDPATYLRHGFERCVVVPNEERWPLELWEKVRGTYRSRLALRRFATRGEPWDTCFGDVMLASLLARRPVKILSATGLVAVDAEDVRALSLRDDVVVPAGQDPVAALVRLRPPEGTDDRLRAGVRGVANPAAWGIFARLDQHRDRRGRLHERYAAWSWPVIAAAIPAIVRMWLAMAIRAVSDAGGSIIAMDTDGFAALASPEGGALTLDDGRTVTVLSWAEVDGICKPFDDLDPFCDGGRFWTSEREVEGRPLHMISLGPKRYTKAIYKDGTWQVVGGTEHSLGGSVVDPPGWGERDRYGLRRWVRSVHEHVLACATGPDPGWDPPWAEVAGQPWPVLRRFQAATADALADVPDSLGLQPFGTYVRLEPDKLFGDPGAPVALDPGDDLTGWASSVSWTDAAGHQVRVGTDGPGDVDVVGRALSEFAYEWTKPSPPEDDSLVELDPRLVRRVGRGGALIDAQLADPEARPEDHLVVYTEGDAAGLVADEARRLGPRQLARLTGLSLKVAERAALGQPISPTNVERALHALIGRRDAGRRCALSGCEELVTRPNALYCTKVHADRAYRQRRRGQRAAMAPDPFSGVPTCAACGSYMRGAADTRTGLCADCAEGEP